MTSKSLSAIFVTSLFIFAFAWDAHSLQGEKGIVESPVAYIMGVCTDVDPYDGECDGSEAKALRDGSWLLEILGVVTTETYVICLEYEGIDVSTGEVTTMAIPLATGVLADEDGELKETEDGNVTIPAGIYWNPRFVVREEVFAAVEDGVCSGGVYFTSGVAVDGAR